MTFIKFLIFITFLHICVYITVANVMSAWVPTITDDTGVVILDFLVAWWGVNNIAGNLTICAVLYGAVIFVPALAILAVWSSVVFARDYLGVSLNFSFSTGKKME
jgi:hypothetical protein